MLGHTIKQWEAPLPLALLKADWSLDSSLFLWFLGLGYWGVSEHECRNRIISPYMHMSSALSSLT